MATTALSTQGFKDKVFDFVTEQDWKFKGDLPVIIDFYADCCGSCCGIGRIVGRVRRKIGDL